MDNPFLRPTPDFKPLSFAYPSPTYPTPTHNSPFSYPRTKPSYTDLSTQRRITPQRSPHNTNPFTRPIDFSSNRLRSDPFTNKNFLSTSNVQRTDPFTQRDLLSTSNVQRTDYSPRNYSPITNPYDSKPQKYGLDDSHETYIDRLLHYNNKTTSQASFSKDLKENLFDEKYEQYRYKPITKINEQTKHHTYNYDYHTPTNQHPYQPQLNQNTYQQYSQYHQYKPQKETQPYLNNNNINQYKPQKKTPYLNSNNTNQYTTYQKNNNTNQYTLQKETPTYLNSNNTNQYTTYLNSNNTNQYRPQKELPSYSIKNSNFSKQLPSKSDLFTNSPNNFTTKDSQPLQSLNIMSIPIVSNINNKKSNNASKSQFKDFVDDGDAYGSDDSFDKPYQFQESDFPEYKESAIGQSSSFGPNKNYQLNIPQKKTQPPSQPDVINYRGQSYYKAKINEYQ